MASKIQDRVFLALLRTYGSSLRCLVAKKGAAASTPKLFARRASSTALGALSTSDRLGHHKRRAGPRTWQRHASTGPPKEVAVLGGGLTGLTTAYYLTLFLPAAHITVYESSSRLGGWIDTETVEVEVESGPEPSQHKHVFLERGARTIVPNTKAAKWDEVVFYELVERLKLWDSVSVLRGPSLLDNRYLYYPDHLVRVPSQLPLSAGDPLGSLSRVWDLARTVMTEPLFTGLLSSLAHGARFQPGSFDPAPKWPFGRNRGVPADDMSIGDFAAQLLGRRDLVDNALSGLVHGVYGGDLWQLSVASSFLSSAWLRLSWDGEENGKVPLIPRDLTLLNDLMRDKKVARAAIAHQGKTLFTMRNGMGTLTDALAAKLERNPRVTLRRDERVSKLEHDQTHGKVKITTAASKGPQFYDKVISTLLSSTVYELTGKVFSALCREDAVTIQVVNLFYPQPRLNHPHAAGFGYLIPSTVDFETQNPEAALGVLFDSDIDAAVALADPARDPAVDPWPHTKLTVMLGGHHWDFLRPEDWPAPHEAAAAARAVVHRHLGIPLDLPAFAAVKTCRDCIPQHRVGHLGRMALAHHSLARAFAGRLSLVGGSYTAQGVLPSLRAARDAAVRAAAPPDPDKDPDDVTGAAVDTGLAHFAHPGEDDLAIPIDRRLVPLRFGNGADMLRSVGEADGA